MSIQVAVLREYTAGSYIFVWADDPRAERRLKTCLNAE